MKDVEGTVDGKSYDKRSDFNEALRLKLAESMLTDKGNFKKIDGLYIADVNGVGIYVDAKGKFGTIYAQISKNANWDLLNARVDTFQEEINGTDFATKIINGINKIPSSIASLQKSVEELDKKISRINKKMGAPFEYARELREKQEGIVKQGSVAP